MANVPFRDLPSQVEIALQLPPPEAAYVVSLLLPQLVPVASASTDSKIKMRAQTALLSYASNNKPDLTSVLEPELSPLLHSLPGIKQM